MQTLTKLAQRLAVITGLVALAFLGDGIQSSLEAGGKIDRYGARMAKAGHKATTHQSILRMRRGDRLPQTRKVTIGVNKSMLVELSHELRDVVVSSPDIMDAVVQSSNRVYLIGKKLGHSNAFFFDSTGKRILTLEIAIERDTSHLDALLARLLPGSKIKTEVMNDTVILTGTVKSAIQSNRAANIASRFSVQPNPAMDTRSKFKVINLLKVQGEEQVLLKVIVAEVQRSVLKQMGMNIGAIAQSESFTTSFLTDNALPLTTAAGLGNVPIPGIATTPPDSAGLLALFNGGATNQTFNPFGNSGVTASWGTGGNRVTKALRMLERNGLIKTLAEPNLTAVSGEAAKFIAGGEYPIPVVNTQGQTSVTYKEFGVRLAFTPVVMSEGRISLAIETEVSELTNTGAVTLSSISIPAIKKRTAKSTVELPSGGSLALAGLIKDDVRQNVDGMPGLKDLPVLGTLFRSRDFIREETELVVIVTPYVVRATSRKKLGRPDDGLAAATERKADFLGHINRVYKTKVGLPMGGTKDDYGFIVD